MTWHVAVVAETWERPLAWVTSDALLGSLPPGGRVPLPRHLAPSPAGFDAARLALVDVGDGFVSREVARRALLAAAGAVPVQEVWPGVLPCGRSAVDRTYGVEWHGPPPGPAPLMSALDQPLHRPPRRPCHRRSRMGGVEVCRVDAGRGWFDGIGERPGLSRMWPHYGADAPVFVINTNDFDESHRPPATSIWCSPPASWGYA